MLKNRVSVPEELQARLKYNCRNRCAICAIMNNDYTEKQGQIAHIDHDHANSLDYDNLVWLCLEHHDKYDSTTSQSKNYRPKEVLMYKRQLETYYAESQNNELISCLTEETCRNDRNLPLRSQNNVLISCLTDIVQILNKEDGYMLPFEVIKQIESFVNESSYPEKYGLSDWRRQLQSIRSSLQNILNIFAPSNYHLIAEGSMLVFNMGKSPDEILEKNKNDYSQFLSELNAQYDSFIQAKYASNSSTNIFELIQGFLQ